MTIRARGCLNALLITIVAAPALIAAAAARSPGFHLLPLLLIGVTGMLLLGWIALTPHSITMTTTDVQITRLVGRLTLPAADVSAVTAHWYGLHVVCPSRRVLLPSLDAVFNARAAAAARRELPQRPAAHAPWVSAGRARSVPESRGNRILAAVGVAGLLALAALIGPRDIPFALLFGCSALALSAGLLWWYPLAAHFDDAGLQLRYALRTHRIALPAPQTITLHEETRTVRRIPRRIAVLTFTLADGRRMRWIPFESAFPLDYIEEELFPQAEALAQRLRYGYQTLDAAPVRHDD